jgi:uncharacterized membrane protein YkvA (DUF1232 family)
MIGKVFDSLPLLIRFILSIVFLLAAIVYTISPIDLIPDLLGPIGWVDDIGIWVVSIISNYKLLIKKRQRKEIYSDQKSKKPKSFFNEDV